jgi:topoisomerase-4 subunit A
MEHVPGPDFPGGGQIISSEAEISAAYETGRGSLKVRARWKIEDLARGQWQLVITELPPNTAAQKVLEEIEEQTNPKIKLGKKALTPEQLQGKQTMLGLLDAVRDESGKDAPVRLVFEPKSSRIDQTEFVNTLLAHTSLESNASLNMVMVGGDGRPRQKGLSEILHEWIAFRFATVTRRTRHRLTKVDDRIHILEGRMIVFLNIDEVIRIIRESDEPKVALMAAFGLSDRQAEDILEIRLRQLARLEKIKIEKELAELRDEKAKLEELLGSESAMKRLLIKEVEADAKQYGDERRTLIREERRTIVEVQRIDEPVTVIVSEKGWVRTVKGHGVAEASGAPTVKAGDRLYGVYECRSVDSLIAFADNGRVYTVPVASLPGGRGEGQPVTSFIDLEPQTRLEQFFAGTADIKLLIAATSGHGLMARVADMTSRQRGGKSFVTLEAEARLLRPAIVAADDSAVACLSERARLLVFGLDEVKLQAAGGRGVTLQDLDAGEQLLAAVAISDSGVTVEGPSGTRQRQLALSGAALAAHFGKRARKGRKIDARMKPETLCRTSRK